MRKLTIVAAFSVACGGSYVAAQSASPDAVAANASAASMQGMTQALREGDSTVAPRSDSGSAFAVTEEMSAVQMGLPACACVRGLVESESPDAALVGATRNLQPEATDESKSAVPLISSFMTGAASLTGAASDRSSEASVASAFTGAAVSAEMAAANPDVNTP